MRQLGRLLQPLELHGRTVQLRTIRLEASEPVFGLASSWLSADEAERAGRFRFDKHRQTFVLGRAVLRAFIANFLQMPPAEVKFAYGIKGKPALADGRCPLRFNVSNSGDLAAYAFTLDREIGVDIEHRRRVVDIESIARRFFAPSEVAELMRLPEPDRHEGFFNCWTRKEAYIKAVGDGLSVPLDSFEVTLGPCGAAQMLGLNGSAEAAGCWTMHAFTPDPEYTGAIAYCDHARPLEIQPLISVDELFAA